MFRERSEVPFGVSTLALFAVNVDKLVGGSPESRTQADRVRTDWTTVILETRSPFPRFRAALF